MWTCPAFALQRSGALSDLEVELDTYGRVDTWKWTSNGQLQDGYDLGYNQQGVVTTRDNLKNSAFNEVYGVDKLGRRTSYYREGSTSDSLSWTLDTAGNRYGPRYATDYGLMNEFVDRAAADGWPTTIRLSRNTGGGPLVSLRHDPWGKITAANQLGEMDYDALGRVVDSSIEDTELYYAYDGKRIQEGNGDVLYVWSPVTHQLVLRQLGSERQFVLHDPEGNTTAVTDASGQILERYVYDQDGSYTALKENWSSYLFQEGGSFDTKNTRLDWKFFHGQNLFVLVNQDPVTQFADAGRGGFYVLDDGTAYDPHSGRTIVANSAGVMAGYNAFDPDAGLSGWDRFVVRTAVPTLQFVTIVGSFIPGPIGWISFGTNMALNAAVSIGSGASVGDAAQDAAFDGAITLASVGLVRNGGVILRGATGLAARNPAVTATAVTAVGIGMVGTTSEADGAVGSWLRPAIRALGAGGVRREVSMQLAAINAKRVAEGRAVLSAARERVIRRAMRSELQLQAMVEAMPWHKVIGVGGQYGTHGADLISYNRLTGRITFWDAKYRRRATNLRMSSTFDVGSDRLRNAVAEARKIVGYGRMSGHFSHAEESLLLAALDPKALLSVHTVPFGRARTWVSGTRMVP